MAEADGNRTRQAGVPGLTGVEDRAAHQDGDASLCCEPQASPDRIRSSGPDRAIGSRETDEVAAPWIPRDRLPLRLVRLAAGLLLFGFSNGLMLVAGLGVDPWDVLHQGLSRTLGLQVGTWAIIASGVVLLAWVPLRQRPGLGTLANALAVGLVINATLALVPRPHALALRAVEMVAGVLLNAVATGLYIGAGLGPGARDGLMTGFAARGHSVRVVRTTIEVVVLAVGFALGGNVGVGTVLYAFGIGPLVHWTIPWLRLRDRPASAADRTAAAGGGVVR